MKQGNIGALDIFGLGNSDAVVVSNLKIARPSITIGQSIEFTFDIRAVMDTKVRIEYGVDYVKTNGKHSRKIFQLSEIAMKQNEIKTYTRKHSFADVSIRKHHAGIHNVVLVVNGKEFGVVSFDLGLVSAM